MQPDLNAFFDMLCSRYAWDFGALTVNPGLASGLVYGTNPPWTISDFLATYPKWGGNVLMVTGTVAPGSPTVTGITGSLTGATAGQYLLGPSGLPNSAGLLPWPYIPAGTTIADVNSSSEITLSQNAIAAGTVQIVIFIQPIVPVLIIATYIALASASLQQCRWFCDWAVAMGLFVSHFVTLYWRSEGACNSVPGVAAVAGLKQGITVSSSAGPVSQGLDRVPDLDAWAAWNQTQYGVELATRARGIGAGPIYVI